MTVKIIIFRQNSRPDQFLLQNIHKLKQILRMIISDIVYRIRWNRQSIFSNLLFRWSLHHTHHALYNIINIGKITLAVPVIKNLNLFIIFKFIRKSKICHIRSSCRTIYRKETKSCGWNIVKFTVGMCHQLI